MELSWEAWLTLGVILLIIVVLVRGWLRPEHTFIGATIILMATVLTPQQALEGFANLQLATIVLLLALSHIIGKTGIIQRLLLNSPKKLSGKKFIWRTMSVVGASSAILNNTPLVAITIPPVLDWGKQNKVPASKLLLPLSYASILGGCVTLVGTSTNLIVNGLAIESGAQPLSIFDFTPVGLTMLVLGLLYLYFFAYRSLPEKTSAVEELIETKREYFAEATIGADSILAGKTIGVGGLRHLRYLYLAEVMRGENKFPSPSRDFQLAAGDRLFFVGNTNSTTELLELNLGLTLPGQHKTGPGNFAEVAECVVSGNAPMVNKTVREIDFRSLYDGTVMAIHRAGERLSGKIGDIELMAGDALLILCGDDFYARINNSPGLYLLSSRDRPIGRPSRKAYAVAAGVLLAIIGSAFGLFPLLLGLSVVFFFGLITQVLKPAEMLKAIDFNLVIVIALGLAIGKALVVSGAAVWLSHFLAVHGNKLQPFVLLSVLFLGANLLSAFITSKAAVALVIPVVVKLATDMAWPIEPFVLIVAFGAAANFITPFGYQTNLMVYGPGGYSLGDFFRIGLPLTILYWIVAVSILMLTYSL